MKNNCLKYSFFENISYLYLLFFYALIGLTNNKTNHCIGLKTEDQFWSNRSNRLVWDHAEAQRVEPNLWEWFPEDSDPEWRPDNFQPRHCEEPGLGNNHLISFKWWFFMMAKHFYNYKGNNHEHKALKSFQFDLFSSKLSEIPFHTFLLAKVVNSELSKLYKFRV